jgi:diacylglycerol kinase family enzyme
MHATKFVHLINPNRQKRRGVERFFRDHAQLNSVFIERTSHPTHIETVVEWAVNEGHEHVAVWGGDGTFHRVVQKLYEMNALGRMVLALIPVGTCNDLARAMKIPAWKTYAEQFLTGVYSETTADLGLLALSVGRHAARHVFVNNAGFGRRPAALQKHRSNAVSDILALTAKRIDLDWNTGQSQSFETRDILLGVVCNAPFFNKGLHFSEDVSAHDGLLDIFLEPEQGRLGLITRFVRGRLGGALKNSRTIHISATELTVHSTELLFPQADGEVISARGTNRLIFSITPQAMRLARWS